MSNTTQQGQRIPFSIMISKPSYQGMINRALQDPKKIQRFVASITSAVAVNPALQECEAPTILSGALQGEALGLSPSPQMGQYYLVPFKDKKNNVTNAQFILGYKGYIQLVRRSGDCKHLNVVTIKQGELDYFDPLTEKLSLNPIRDETERENAPAMGYAAFFEAMDGFTKTIYWSREKMLAHADRYSQAFSLEAKKIKVQGEWKTKVSFADYEAGNFPKEDEWMYSSFWYKDFDAMAHKTLLRQLISKWCVLSIELQAALGADETVRSPENYLQPHEQPENEGLPEASMGNPASEQETQTSFDEL